MSLHNLLRCSFENGLKPCVLSVVDESHLHKGHAASRPEGETHFRVSVVSAQFDGLSLVQRHRLVYGLAAEALQRGVHALTLETKTPEEWAQREN